MQKCSCSFIIYFREPNQVIQRQIEIDYDELTFFPMLLFLLFVWKSNWIFPHFLCDAIHFNCLPNSFQLAIIWGITHAGRTLVHIAQLNFYISSNLLDNDAVSCQLYSTLMLYVLYTHVILARPFLSVFHHDIKAIVEATIYLYVMSVITSSV